MGCFLACFGSADGRRRKRGSKSLPRDRSRRNYESLQPASPAKPFASEEAVVSPVESREKTENLSFNSRKKVTFDLNVNTYIEVHSSLELLNSSEAVEEKEKENSDAKAENQNGGSTDSAARPSPVSFPSNHRYQNCVLSDEEVGDDDDDDGDGDDDEYGYSDFEEDEEDDEIEESYESCFSIPLGGSGEKTCPDFGAKREVNSPAPIPSANGPRDRSQYVHSVLNPVENLSQWKAVKAKPFPLKNQKENLATEEEAEAPPSGMEPTFQSPKPKRTFQTEPKDNLSSPSPLQEIRVDASLSNWLASPMATTADTAASSERNASPKSNSSMKYEDRPILGALTMEEIRRSASSSPRKSPSRSPDEIPILGTVGSYWTHQNKTMDFKGIPNTTNKYREDKVVNWHSTPFDVRLERALKGGLAEATC